MVKRSKGTESAASWNHSAENSGTNKSAGPLRSTAQIGTPQIPSARQFADNSFSLQHFYINNLLLKNQRSKYTHVRSPDIQNN